jgi:hypothetical protein
LNAEFESVCSKEIVMRRPLLVITVLAVLAGCDSKSPVAPTVQTPVPVTPSTPQVVSVSVTGDSRFTVVNSVRQFTANARMQDGSVRDVTTEASWASSNSDVVSVSNRGEVTSIGPGLATIFATYTLDGSIDVSVASESTSRLSGLYLFVLTAAPECSALPGWARLREYGVSIDQSGAEHAGSETALELTAQLQPGMAPRLTGSISGSKVTFFFPGGSSGGGYYYYYGPTWPAFAHTIDTTTMYTLTGEAVGTKSASQDVHIAGTFSGVVAVVNPSSRATLADCTSARHSFTLARR